MILSYDIASLEPYINWVYFYHAWQVQQPSEQHRLREEAVSFLHQELAGRYRAYALFAIVKARGQGDDIIISDPSAVEKEFCLPMLRQQQGHPCLCLADFVHPVADRIGLFATSTDRGMEQDFDADPYQKMMAQLLADRLAEAAAERMHQQVRMRDWGYAPDEQLSIAELLQEHFQGIRPAVGYPSLPDASLNFLLDHLLQLSQIGISLTESGAMRPHASVSGLMLAHPQARYFSVGKIGSDQLSDYARRRGYTFAEARRFLAGNI